MESYELHTLEDTRELAKWIAGNVRAGDAVCLTGDLGTGKTTLVRYFAEALGIDAAIVNSPTYVLINLYPNPAGPELAHVDAYRLSSPEDTESLGWDEVADGSRVLAVEWAERIDSAIPGPRILVRLEHAPAGRLASVEWSTGRAPSESLRLRARGAKGPSDDDGAGVRGERGEG